MDRLYKVLGETGGSLDARNEVWKLPKNGQPGDWMRLINGPLSEANGYHLYRARDLVSHLGPVIYEAEASGEWFETDQDVIVREARLVRRLDTWDADTARDFAAACAEHVLPIFERQQPDDDRPRQAITAARLFGLGTVSANELAAAWKTARDVMTADLLTVSGDALAAARAAAMSAAIGKEWPAGAVVTDVAHAAREAAAWSATRAAARDDWGTTNARAGAALRDTMASAWAAAEVEERGWQTDRLLSYLGLNDTLPADRDTITGQVLVTAG